MSRPGTLRRRHAGKYASWLVMRSRCRARGTPIARRWDSFEAFLEDLGPRPRGCALVRTRSDAPFGPGGYDWQPIAERARRRRRERLTAADVTRIRMKHRHGATKADLARLYGVSIEHVRLIVAGEGWKLPKEKAHAR